jgi:hypothetical protein
MNVNRVVLVVAVALGVAAVGVVVVARPWAGSPSARYGACPTVAKIAGLSEFQKAPPPCYLRTAHGVVLVKLRPTPETTLIVRVANGILFGSTVPCATVRASEFLPAPPACLQRTPSGPVLAYVRAGPDTTSIIGVADGRMLRAFVVRLGAF